MLRIEAILDEKFRESEIPTVKGLACEIHDSKKLGSMIVFLTENYPLPKFDLNHLKRIDSKRKPKRIFVCLAPDQCHADSEIDVNKLEDLKLREFLLNNDMNKLLVLDIPAVMPITRAQNVNALALWPINFHENKHLEKCLSETLYNEKESARIQELFSQLQELKKESGMGAIITKQHRSIIVAKTCVETSEQKRDNPLAHPVLHAIEEVSEKHRIAKELKEECPEDLKHYQDDYLCTNYDCFLTQDPCIMCAMALVHSRVKRVFILNSPTEFPHCSDAAFQTHRLHCLANLNHHFEVFLVHSLEDKPRKHPHDPSETNDVGNLKKVKLTNGSSR